MTPVIVASAFKRFTASCLRFGGGKCVLIKKINGKYVVKEAEHVSNENGKLKLHLTGRMFEYGDGKTGIYHSPLLAAMMNAFTEKEIEIEVAIAKLIGAWGCWPHKFISIIDGHGDKIKLDLSPSVFLDKSR